jgi:hypothetical protein
LKKKTYYRISFFFFWFLFQAARNVLVGRRGVVDVKLADLGMARTVAKDYYKKNTTSRVPIRWMAPESIRFVW